MCTLVNILQKTKSLLQTSLKGTVSPAERCDFVGVKLEKVHELFQVWSYLWERSGVL